MYVKMKILFAISIYSSFVYMYTHTCVCVFASVCALLLLREGGQVKWMGCAIGFENLSPQREKDKRGADKK